MGVPCLVLVLLCILLSLSSYDKFSVAVTHGAMGLSEVCNCGTSLSYSLTFYGSIHLSLVLVAYSSRKGLDETAHLRTLTRAFENCSRRRDAGCR